MINMPTTDILTPITGEVEKTLATDHSDAAEVSFLSVISTEDVDTDALVTVSNLPLAPQTHPRAQADFLGLAAAFIPAPETLAPPHAEPLIAENHAAAMPRIPIEKMDTAPPQSGDAHFASAVDKHQKTNVAPPNLDATVHHESGVAPKAIANVSGLFPVAPGTSGELPILKKGTVVIAPTTEPALGADPQTNENRHSPQYSRVGAAPAGRPAEVMPAAQNPPANVAIAASNNAALSHAIQPQKNTASPEQSWSIHAAGNADEKPHNTPVIAQQTPNLAKLRTASVEPMNTQPSLTAKGVADGKLIMAKPFTAPIQNHAARPVQVPTDGVPMTSGISDTPAGAQNANLKPDVTPASGAAPLHAAEATLNPEMPMVKNMAPVQERQTQAKQAPKQYTEAAQIQSAQPYKYKHAQPTDMAAMTSRTSTVETTAATPAAEALELLSTPEIMPLDVKSADSILASRLDATANRPEVMRHVAQQLADAARQMPDRPVELALNPEELGRVRLTFTTTDNGIHIAVMAERGETMDLLRRHIETLAQEFREMGYKDVKFEFSGEGQNETQSEDSDAQNTADSDGTLAQTQTLDPVQLSLEPSTGLDLRL